MEQAIKLFAVLLFLSLAVGCAAGQTVTPTPVTEFPGMAVQLGGGMQQPLRMRPTNPDSYCESRDTQGPSAPPSPFLYQPFEGTFSSETWTAQMDHDQPTYQQNGVFATLGEILRPGTRGPGLAGGTEVYQVSGRQWFNSDTPYETLIRQGYFILAYQSPSFETYLYYDGHDGHDFAATGKALAAADGGVVFKGDYGNALGRVVEIYHPNGYLTRYAHLASFESGIDVGTQVKAGQPIGTIGGSAVVDGKLIDNHWGTHLHFAVFRWTGNEWHITDPFGWDPWAGPDQQSHLRKQREDPLIRCNGEVSYNLWVGGWPRPYESATETAPFPPTQDRYLGGWLGEMPSTLTPQAATPPISIIGFNYKTRDVGEGWIEGNLRLGFENISDEPLAALCLIFDREKAEIGMWSSGCPEDSIVTEEVFVETTEGKTYPAEVSPPAIELGSTGYNLPILPHVPFQHIDTAFGYVFQTATFRFAQAAHPVALVFRGNSAEFRIDLTNVPETLPPPNFSVYHVKPISQLVNEHFLKGSERVTGSFEGECVYKYVPGFYNKAVLLPYTIINSNQLDSETYELWFKHAVYYPSGQLRYFVDYGDTSFTIGPGQTEKHEFMLFDEDVDPDNDGVHESEDSVRASYVFVFSQNGDISVYKLDCREE